MSAIMITGGNPRASVGQGFGLLPHDVVIDQHFQNRKRQKRLFGVLEKYPRCLGLGIDEQTAVVVRGRTFTVVGKANVSICLPPSKQEPGADPGAEVRRGGQLVRTEPSHADPPKRAFPIRRHPTV